MKVEKGFTTGETDPLLQTRTVLHDLTWRWVEEGGPEWQRPLRARRLAMLALREQCQWDLHEIGEAFGIHKGNVLRGVARAVDGIRDQVCHGHSLPGRDVDDDGFSSPLTPPSKT